MQPTYLPWIGYFKMMQLSDLFILLDDVQFDKRSFQQRNQILVNKRKKFLTVPVLSKGKFDQNIKDVEIDNKSKWYIDHLKTIQMNYSKHKNFYEFFDMIEKIYLNRHTKLIDLNYDIISVIKNYLNIKTKIELSSKYDVNKKKEFKIIEILKKVGASEYLSPVGSKAYIGDGKIFKDNNILLNYFLYNCKEYEQKNTEEFISHLSILDIIFNLGEKSKDFI